MRFPATAAMWQGVPEFWTSRVLTPQVLAAGRRDRSLWVDVGPKIAGFDTNAVAGARAWAESERIAMLFQGTGSLGLPANLASTIQAGLGKLVLNPPDDVESLLDALTDTAIAIAVEALAAVPVVGSVARAIGSIALMLRDLADKAPEEVAKILPPLRVYDDAEEEFVMNNQLLPTLQTGDWTRLFTPRLDPTVSVSELDRGWLLDSMAGGGFGYIPGTQQISSAIQVFMAKPSYRQPTGDHQDIGSFYAGPAQLMTAIDQQVQQPGPALWAVVPATIRRRWREFLDGLLQRATELWEGKNLGGTGLSGLSETWRHNVVQQLVAPFHVSELEGEVRRGWFAANSWTPGGDLDDIFDAFVEPWCARIESMQWDALETTAVAYADPESAAFEDSSRLRRRLEEMRAELLKSPARFAVDQRDVVDAEYRKLLFERTTGGSLKSPDGGGPLPKPKRLDGKPARLREPVPPRGGAPFERLPSGKGTSGGGVAAAAVGLAALGGIWVARSRGR